LKRYEDVANYDKKPKEIDRRFDSSFEDVAAQCRGGIPAGLSSTRFIQPIAVLIATPNWDIPLSIAATTRLRRSRE
jgi:hypothetical protein